MFKPGILEPQDLKRSLKWLGRPKLLAYSLLRPSSHDDPTQVDVFEAVIKYVRLASGVSCTTYRNRFADLDAVTTKVLMQYFPVDRLLRVGDWAVSDGITSIEWARTLLQAFPRLEFTASDNVFNLIEATDNERERYILEPDGTVLQYIWPPWVVSMKFPESIVYIVNRLLRVFAGRKLRSLGNAFRAVSSEQWNAFAIIEHTPWIFQKISLVHPDVKGFLQQMAWFQLSYHDAFCPLDIPTNVIRTMNIYNRNLFSDEMLQRGIRAVGCSLADGGIWIVGKTDEVMRRGTNDVTIFRRNDLRMTVVERLGRGSEIEDLIVSILF